MTDLAEFLLARIAEDETAALSVLNDKAYFRQVSWGWFDADFGEFHPSDYAGPLPARTVAECEAKRRIVTAFEADPSYVRFDWWKQSTCSDNCGPDVLDAVLKLLALPYADHADYDEIWRP